MGRKTITVNEDVFNVLDDMRGDWTWNKFLRTLAKEHAEAASRPTENEQEYDGTALDEVVEEMQALKRQVDSLPRETADEIEGRFH